MLSMGAIVAIVGIVNLIGNTGQVGTWLPCLTLGPLLLYWGVVQRARSKK